jgi:hypothetical protein
MRDQTEVGGLGVILLKEWVLGVSEGVHNGNPPPSEAMLKIFADQDPASVLCCYRHNESIPNLELVIGHKIHR